MGFLKFIRGQDSVFTANTHPLAKILFAGIRLFRPLIISPYGQVFEFKDGVLTGEVRDLLNDNNNRIETIMMVDGRIVATACASQPRGDLYFIFKFDVGDLYRPVDLVSRSIEFFALDHLQTRVPLKFSGQLQLALIKDCIPEMNAEIRNGK